MRSSARLEELLAEWKRWPGEDKAGTRLLEFVRARWKAAGYASSTSLYTCLRNRLGIKPMFRKRRKADMVLDGEIATSTITAGRLLARYRLDPETVARIAKRRP